MGSAEVAAPAARPSTRPTFDGADLTIGIVSARWNADVVDRLVAGARRAADDAGARVQHHCVPGAFELPFGAHLLAATGAVDAIVVVGCVIRGETTHYEIVSEGCAQGVMRVQLEHGLPVGLGIVTVENHDQALARAGGAGDHNVGEDATWATLEMAALARHLSTG